ncbi:hypothetical protein KKF34_06205 [Myxococcota bacterium]|nr:hypothetical protein [Myxococcota bacterium]MBU1379192.1 hypothetical protein [Myxococcota bacterium]MBU1496451.1 hypothetical protein [Myxococcota bacterium]
MKRVGSSAFATPNTALTIARGLGFSAGQFDLVGPSKWRSIYDAILDRFAKGGAKDARRVVWLWEFLKDEAWYRPRENEPLEVLEGFGDPETRVFLLLEHFRVQDGERPLWLFRGSLRATLRTLEELPFTEFTITPTSMEWLVIENHHDLWIAVGEGADRVVGGERVPPL